MNMLTRRNFHKSTVLMGLWALIPLKSNEKPHITSVTVTTFFEISPEANWALLGPTHDVIIYLSDWTTEYYQAKDKIWVLGKNDKLGKFRYDQMTYDIKDNELIVRYSDKKLLVCSGLVKSPLVG